MPNDLTKTKLVQNEVGTWVQFKNAGMKNAH